MDQIQNVAIRGFREVNSIMKETPFPHELTQTTLRSWICIQSFNNQTKFKNNKRIPWLVLLWTKIRNCIQRQFSQISILLLQDLKPNQYKHHICSKQMRKNKKKKWKTKADTLKICSNSNEWGYQKGQNSYTVPIFRAWKKGN